MLKKYRLAVCALALLPLSAAAVDYLSISGWGLTPEAAHQQLVSAAYQTCPAGTTIMLHEVSTVLARHGGYYANALLSCHSDPGNVPPGTKPGLMPSF